MSLASYQGWEVGAKTVPLTGPKVYQFVMDAGPYRWQRHQQVQHQFHNHNQTESTKGNLSTISMFKQHTSSSSSHCLSSTEPTGKANVLESTGVAPPSSPVSSNRFREQEECGPVSSYVLPSLAAYPGSERVSVIGAELEHVNSYVTPSRGNSPVRSNGTISQRLVRNGRHLKVHPHDHEDYIDSCSQDVSKPHLIAGGLSKAFSKDCHEVQSTVFRPILIHGNEGPALSSSSSSIGVGGEHSFSSNGSDDNTGDGEVESALRTPALSTLAALEDALPIKRGLSRYYAGQSKSFGCLSDALSTSLAKPANPYSRRRKNFVLCDDWQRNCPPVSRKSASSISKKNSFGSKANLALAVAMEAAEQDEDDNDNEDYEEEDNDRPTPLPRMGLGRHHDNSTIPPSRSYSLSDLEGAVPPTRAFSFSDLQGASKG